MQKLPALVHADGVTPLQREAAVGDTRWNGTSHGRQNRDWRVSAGSSDADNRYEIDTAAYRGRDLERNEGQIYSAIQHQVQHVVGSGLQVVPTPDYVTLGKDKAWADGWFTARPRP